MSRSFHHDWADKSMYFYKYCSPGDLQFGMLSRGEVFFASPDELNDGSECRPRYVLKGSIELWRRLCEYLLLDLWICLRGDSLAPGDYPRTLADLAEPLAVALKKRASRRDLAYEHLWPSLRQELSNLLRNVDSPIPPSAVHTLVDRVSAGVTGILHEHRYMACFTRSPCDPTMWGHYGGAERGFCLVICAPESKLRIRSPARLLWDTRPSTRMPGAMEVGIYNDAEVNLEPIRYRPAPPRINAFRRLIPRFHYSEAEEHYDVPEAHFGHAPERQENLLGLVKATTWKYEREFRALLPTTDRLAPEARCFQLDLEQVQGVIFGPKMSPGDKERTVVACHLLQASRSTANPRSTPFAFLNARQQVDSFQVAISPAGILKGVYGERMLPFKSLRELDQPTAEALRKIAVDVGASSGAEQRQDQK